MDKMLTPSEAAVKMKVSTATIYRWCKLGYVKHYRRGNRLTIPESALLGELVEARDLADIPNPYYRDPALVVPLRVVK